MVLQADVYSLGVLLWEIVTSDVPERGRMRPLKVHPSSLSCAVLCCAVLCCAVLCCAAVLALVANLVISLQQVHATRM